MNTPTIPHQRALMWTTLLVSAVAWAASLVVMLWLTNPVCQGRSRSVLIWVGVVCGVAALVASYAAKSALGRAHAERDDDVASFILRLSFWGGLLFALVIALSLVPTAFLTPCPG